MTHIPALSNGTPLLQRSSPTPDLVMAPAQPPAAAEPMTVDTRVKRTFDEGVEQGAEKKACAPIPPTSTSEAKPRTLYNPHRRQVNAQFFKLSSDTTAYELPRYVMRKSQPQGREAICLESSKSEIANEEVIFLAPFKDVEQKWKFVMELSVLGAAFHRLILGKTQPKAYATVKIKEDKPLYSRMIKYVESSINLGAFLENKQTRLSDNNQSFEFSYQGTQKVLPLQGLFAAVIASLYCGDFGDSKATNFLLKVQQQTLRAVRIDPECTFAEWFPQSDQTDDDLVGLLNNPIENMTDTRLVEGIKEGLNSQNDPTIAAKISSFLHSDQNRQETYAALARIFSLPTSSYLELMDKHLSEEFNQQKRSLNYLFLNNHYSFLMAAMKLEGFEEFYASYPTSPWPRFFGDPVTTDHKPLKELSDQLLARITVLHRELIAQAAENRRLATQCIKERNLVLAKEHIRAAYNNLKFLDHYGDVPEADFQHAKEGLLAALLVSPTTTPNELRQFMYDHATTARKPVFLTRIINKLLSFGSLRDAMELSVLAKSLESAMKVLRFGYKNIEDPLYKNCVYYLSQIIEGKNLDSLNALIQLQPSLRGYSAATVFDCLQLYLQQQPRPALDEASYQRGLQFLSELKPFANIEGGANERWLLPNASDVELIFNQKKEQEFLAKKIMTHANQKSL